MARKKKKRKNAKQAQLVSIMDRLSRSYRPDEILREPSKIYENYSAASTTEAEVDYWLKCSRATGNLSSGMSKWLYEVIDELENESED